MQTLNKIISKYKLRNGTQATAIVYYCSCLKEVNVTLQLLFTIIWQQEQSVAFVLWITISYAV